MKQLIASIILIVAVAGCNGTSDKPDVSGTAKDLSAAAGAAIVDAKVSNGRTGETVKAMTPANVEVKKPEAIAHVGETDRALDRAGGAAAGAVKASEKQEGVNRKQAERIIELEADDPLLGWIRFTAYILIVAGIGAGIAAFFFPLLRSTLIVASGCALVGGFALMAVARYARVIETVMIWTIAAVAVCGAAAGAWLFWKWFDNRRAAKRIIAGMEVLKERGDLKITSAGSKILDQVQTPLARSLVDEVQEGIVIVGAKAKLAGAK